MSWFDKPDLSQKVADWVDCPDCSGTGWIYAKLCWTCHGYKQILVDR